MSQRQSTFQARPAAVTFGPTSETPNRIAPVLNLLGPGRADDVAGIRFRISVRQQPEAARACGSGERDRRTIDPPPIVQLHVDGPNLSHEDKKKYLSWDGYVCHCWIWDQYGTAEASIMPAEYHYQRRLTGSQVAAPFFGKDQKRVEGCFFTFSDLSVRTLGTYKLKFNMIMMDVQNPGQSRHFPNLCEVISRPFTVYTAKDFPGISESSGLVRALRAQGCIISIKKGNEKKRRTGRRCDEDDDSSDD
ncbi:unnamed protein product [Clonostachys byssicola]|uniref:Velvet domain-containing protein n=1 Tax=Clonostachys byssicola TaxID=160290 RepID=A0A9N9TZP2_9HYPO|nr:unnamed protein product [Clonostachys byssicola]